MLIGAENPIDFTSCYWPHMHPLTLTYPLFLFPARSIILLIVIYYLSAFDLFISIIGVTALLPGFDNLDQRDGSQLQAA